jgi:hypothetical protein
MLELYISDEKLKDDLEGTSKKQEMIDLYLWVTVEEYFGKHLLKCLRENTPYL